MRWMCNRDGISLDTINPKRSSVKQRHDDVLRRGAAVVKEAVANLGANRLPNPLPVRRARIIGPGFAT